MKRHQKHAVLCSTQPFYRMWVVALLLFTITMVVVESGSSYDLSQEKRFYDNLEPTVFSPSGSLHAVERVFEEATSDMIGLNLKNLKDNYFEQNILNMPGRLVLGLVCDDFICVVSMDMFGLHDVYIPSVVLMNVDEKGGQGAKDSLLDNENHALSLQASPDFSKDDRSYYFGSECRSPAFVKLDKTIAAITAGDPIDSTILLRRIEDISFNIHKSNGIPSSQFLLRIENGILLADVAQKLADTMQISTQSIGSKAGRMLASSALIFGTHGPGSIRKLCLWRVDPTGQFFSANVASIGRGAGFIEKLIIEQIIEKYNNEITSDHIDRDYRWLLSNEDIEAYLCSLSVKDALMLSCECFQRSTLQSGEPIDNEDSWWDRMQCTIIKRNKSAKDYSCLFLGGYEIKQFLNQDTSEGL